MDNIKEESGIYCIKNTLTNKMYIGQSLNLRKRISDHFRKLPKGTDECTYLQKSYLKYGAEKFEYFILEYCLSSDLNKKEEYYISKYNTKAPNGYNLTNGGDGTVGYKWSDEQIAKKSGENHPLFGIGHSEEAKKKMKENHADFSKENHPFWGKKHSEEAKKKMSEARTGKYSGKNSPLYGKPKSKEQREKIRLSKIGSKSKNATSLFYGVRKVIRGKNKNIFWRSQLRVSGKMIHIGNFKLEEDAARAYNKFVIDNNLPNPLNLFQEEGG